MHEAPYMCIYSSGLGAFAAWAPGARAPGKGSRGMVFHACAGPFWRMRQSILANAHVHLIQCACLFWRMSYFIFVFTHLYVYIYILHITFIISEAYGGTFEKTTIWASDLNGQESGGGAGGRGDVFFKPCLAIN